LKIDFYFLFQDFINVLIIFVLQDSEF